MIKSISIQDSLFEKNPQYIRNIFKKFKSSDGNYKIEFSDGVNLIIGSNGSGKTTIIELIARYMNVSDYDCRQVPQDLHYFGNYGLEDYDELIQLCNSQRGLHYDIDYDHYKCYRINQNSNNNSKKISMHSLYSNPETSYMDMMGELVTYRSTGEDLMNRILQSYDLCNTDAINEDYYKSIKHINGYNDNIAKLMFNNSIKHNSGRPVMLLDEVDSNLDVINSAFCQNMINEMREHYQVIISTHNIITIKNWMNIGANVINLYNHDDEIMFKEILDKF